MLLTIAVVLGILWLLGLVVIHITSPLLHLVLLIALVIFIYDLVTKRGRALGKSLLSINLKRRFKMTEDVQRIRETTTHSGNTVQKTTEVKNPQARTDHQQNVAERIIWFVAGILLVLLGFRFLLSLLGANTTNGFANFIYSTSHPFVSPFFSLFSYNFTNGVSHVEIYTLVAMVFYAVVAYGIAKLVTLNRG